MHSFDLRLMWVGPAHWWATPPGLGVVRECVVWLVASREDPDSLQQWLLFPFLVLEMTVQRLKKNLIPGRHSRG